MDEIVSLLAKPCCTMYECCGSLHYDASLMFSEDTTFERDDGRMVSMKELALGDSVRTANGKLEKIYSFGHYEYLDVDVEFLPIQTRHASSSGLLEVTSNHLVFVVTDDNGRTQPVPAGQIVMGDQLVTAFVIRMSSWRLIPSSNEVFLLPLLHQVPFWRMGFKRRRLPRCNRRRYMCHYQVRSSRLNQVELCESCPLSFCRKAQISSKLARLGWPTTPGHGTQAYGVNLATMGGVESVLTLQPCNENPKSQKFRFLSRFLLLRDDLI